MRARSAVRWATRRIHLWGALIVAALLAVWLSDALGAQIDAVLRQSGELLREHAVLGKLLFAVLAGASAMLAFFSSAVLVPSATAAWGMTTTFALLWAGWIAGGIVAYTIGRWLGRAAVHRFVPAEKLAYYQERVNSDVRWWMLLLLQLALPSELPGYLSGTLRVRFPLYLAAVTLGELPYAVGSVYLGEAFLERNAVVFAGVAIGGLVLFAVAYRVLQAQLARNRPAPSAAAPAAAAAPEEAPPQSVRTRSSPA